jgi:hypothetical protein
MKLSENILRAVKRNEVQRSKRNGVREPMAGLYTEHEERMRYTNQCRSFVWHSVGRFVGRLE